MAHPKPLFVPWLRRQIDSGQYPGVQWVDPEHTCFSIPWKHALRQDSNNSDVLIFKAWAQTSANADGKIPGDPSVWKRNFRSALRARGFKLEEDSKNDAAYPHKVYKWPEDAQSGESKECSQESDSQPPACDVLYLADDEMFPDGHTPPDLLEQCLETLNIGGSQEDTQRPIFVEHPLFIERPVGAKQYSVPMGIQLQMDGAIGGASFPIPETINLEQFAQVGGAVGALGQFSPIEGTVALGQYSPMECAFVETPHQVEDPVLVQHIPVQDTSSDSACNQFSTYFKVTVYYKGRNVLEQLVENEAGFRLMYRRHPNSVRSALPVVELPSPDSLLDQTQAKLTRDILANFGGVEIRRDGAMLLGHRWGETRVYWGPSKHEQGLELRALPKTYPEPVYQLKDFCSSMMEFIENSGRESPSYSLYFFLGEKWPDPKNKPWEKKLIMVEVVLTVLERLKMMAVESGASSLHSVELQLSLEQMMELC